MRNKNRLISFKDEKGNWILRRFLFSKWTLREGWDNPNVFVIAKLRSSGSEISKLQEVGRGLRLPVDENGRRLSDEEFRLSYIIDYSEKDFADKLVGEINRDSGEIFKGEISKEIIDKLVSNNYAENRRQVINKLADEGIIDDNETIIDSQKLQELLPNTGVQKDKIRNNPKKSSEKIKLRKENWEKIKDLWLYVSKRRMIKFDKLTDDEIFNIALKSIGDNLKPSIISIQQESLKYNNKDAKIQKENSNTNSGYKLESIKYGKFLKKISLNTNISPKIWHDAITKKGKKFEKNCFNLTNLQNITDSFSKIFENEFSQKYHYSSLNFTANSSLMRNGEFIDEVSKSILGSFSSKEAKVDERNLWEEICYDSINPEMEISKITPNKEVLVFGKLPQRAIRIPLFNGKTTSPDFIYAIRKKGGVEINLFIEAKSENMKDSEQQAINGQEMFYKTLNDTRWEKVTSAEKVKSLLEEL